MQSHPFKIAIVGLGPKGLYSFERILAQLKANTINEKVEIHLFNKTSFMGSGDVYRSDQPDYLLMNFSNKHINMWTDESPPPVVKNPLSLSAYIALEQKVSLDEIDPLYAPRAKVGCYLENGFARLSQNLPECVILQQRIAEVQSIEKMDDGYSIGFMQREKKYRLAGFRYILIATGHPRHKETSTPNGNTVSFIYPVQHKLNGVTNHDTVAVKGMGLTFIDAVLAITEGKGGLFTKVDDGKLIYTASGREPKHIFPFSKSGWPMMPQYDNILNEHTDLYVKNLMTINHRKLSFKGEILPLIARDMEFAYYKTLFSHEKEVLDFHPDYDVINRQIHNFHQKYPGYVPFSFEGLIEPEFDHTKSIHQNVLEYLGAFICEKSRHIVNKAQWLAAAAWGGISPIFNEIYSFSGLDAASHKAFDGYYFGKLNRIAFGPPSVNLKKIIALANAGIVDFQFAKSPHLATLESGFMLSNDISDIYCDVLIDARIPKNSIKNEATGLFTNLCLNQLARPYENKDNEMTYAPGTVEIDHNGNLINTHGKPENITLYGTPTEGIVHDNDTLSRSRNNFASPWTHKVIQHLMNRRNEINTQSAITYASAK